jgi:hypothetical protein
LYEVIAQGLVRRVAVLRTRPGKGQARAVPGQDQVPNLQGGQLATPQARQDQRLVHQAPLPPEPFNMGSNLGVDAGDGLTLPLPRPHRQGFQYGALPGDRQQRGQLVLGQRPALASRLARSRLQAGQRVLADAAGLEAPRRERLDRRAQIP